VSTFIMAWAIDPENVYWVVHELPGPRASVWATARAGGKPRMLAVLEPGEGETSLFDRIESVGDHLIIYPKGFGFDVPVFSVLKAGGEAKRLPTAWHSATLVGVSTNGTVLVQRQTKVGNGEPRSEEFELGRLRPGADAVEPFWPGHPPTAYAVRAWDDGAGGFYVHAWEWGPNDALHATMWSLDAEGRGRRLGCDPLVRSIIYVAAIGPDAIYAIATPSNSSGYWSVVKIAR
jgi:hypothetical protein